MQFVANLLFNKAWLLFSKAWLLFIIVRIVELVESSLLSSKVYAIRCKFAFQQGMVAFQQGMVAFHHCAHGGACWVKFAFSKVYAFRCKLFFSKAWLLFSKAWLLFIIVSMVELVESSLLFSKVYAIRLPPRESFWDGQDARGCFLAVSGGFVS